MGCANSKDTTDTPTTLPRAVAAPPAERQQPSRRPHVVIDAADATEELRRASGFDDPFHASPRADIEDASTPHRQPQPHVSSPVSAPLGTPAALRAVPAEQDVASYLPTIVPDSNFNATVDTLLASHMLLMSQPLPSTGTCDSDGVAANSQDAPRWLPFTEANVAAHTEREILLLHERIAAGGPMTMGHPRNWREVLEQWVMTVEEPDAGAVRP